MEYTYFIYRIDNYLKTTWFKTTDDINRFREDCKIDDGKMEILAEFTSNEYGYFTGIREGLDIAVTLFTKVLDPITVYPSMSFVKINNKFKSWNSIVDFLG